ncbi:hypothetical protein IWZ03DRAFT_378801 [Phyllosticta citriasiana]|uniref:Uncharacterized protein n=1 Tax=Phyllosticta citriasiana TaxID=595635 RepID=A0ABR1KLC0_9PEZI
MQPFLAPGAVDHGPAARLVRLSLDGGHALGGAVLDGFSLCSRRPAVPLHSSHNRLVFLAPEQRFPPARPDRLPQPRKLESDPRSGPRNTPDAQDARKLGEELHDLGDESAARLQGQGPSFVHPVLALVRHHHAAGLVYPFAQEVSQRQRARAQLVRHVGRARVEGGEILNEYLLLLLIGYLEQNGVLLFCRQVPDGGFSPVIDHLLRGVLLLVRRERTDGQFVGFGEVAGQLAGQVDEGFLLFGAEFGFFGFASCFAFFLLLGPFLCLLLFFLFPLFLLLFGAQLLVVLVVPHVVDFFAFHVFGD